MRARRGLFLALAACLIGVSPARAEDTIYTYAGTGVAASTGDEGPAASATLNQPAGLEIAPDGSLLVAELNGNVIRKITADGMIHAFAGNGSGAHSGDSGPAGAAGIYGPRDLAFSPDKSVLYVLESVGNTVRRINMTTGMISTVVGSGPVGGTGDYGPAGSATLSGMPTPTSPVVMAQGIGVAADGDLYIADTGNNKIRVVDAGANQLIDASDIITTFAGTGVFGVAGDNGAAVNATLAQPTDVLPMPDGSVLIGDITYSSNTGGRLRSVGVDGVIRPYSFYGAGAGGTVVGGDGGPVGNAQINPGGQLQPDGAGGQLIVEGLRNRIRRVAVSGAATTVSTLAGSGSSCTLTDLCGDYGPAVTAAINGPLGVAGSPTGRLYISEGNRIRVRVYAPGAGGPQGPGGIAGSGGVDGSAGQAGSSGTNGGDGPDGANGSAGKPGRVGPSGPTGRNGIGGADGATGSAGADGPSGDAGERGESGDPLAMIGGVPLVVALPASRIVRRHGRITLRIYVSTGTSIAGRVVKDGHVISTRRTFLRAGLKQLDLGRLAGGRYRVVVKASDSRGRSSTDRATLVVR